ncbi:hypothetical protein MP631_20815 [Xanthomonas phaseoli pv. phaseoli]|nr:hypothetical protein MP631_20815 [Xanthomonas phaseoli pv. phaseoli]
MRRISITGWLHIGITGLHLAQRLLGRFATGVIVQLARFFRQREHALLLWRIHAIVLQVGLLLAKPLVAVELPAHALLVGLRIDLAVVPKRHDLVGSGTEQITIGHHQRDRAGTGGANNGSGGGTSGPATRASRSKVQRFRARSGEVVLCQQRANTLSGLRRVVGGRGNAQTRKPCCHPGTTQARDLRLGHRHACRRRAWSHEFINGGNAFQPAVHAVTDVQLGVLSEHVLLNGRGGVGDVLHMRRQIAVPIDLLLPAFTQCLGDRWILEPRIARLFQCLPGRTCVGAAIVNLGTLAVEDTDGCAGLRVHGIQADRQLCIDRLAGAFRARSGRNLPDPVVEKTWNRRHARFPACAPPSRAPRQCSHAIADP